MTKKVFISYARPDVEVAEMLATTLNYHGVEVWADFKNLNAGDNWNEAILQALSSADGIIVIASEQSSKSAWVLKELNSAASNNVPILPVVIDSPYHLPSDLRNIQAIVIRRHKIQKDVNRFYPQIIDWLEQQGQSKFDISSSKSLANSIVEEISKAGNVTSASAKHSVFIVHGHDSEALQSVKNYLREIGVNTIVLKDDETPDDSLLRRFLKIAEKADFAVVVISPDDYGASLDAFDSPKGGENSLRYRARQNVILELGFFLGKLKNFNKVFVLTVSPPEAWPEFELPSDLAGALFKNIDSGGRWKKLLKAALTENGIEVT